MDVVFFEEIMKFFLDVEVILFGFKNFNSKLFELLVLVFIIIYIIEVLKLFYSFF